MTPSPTVLDWINRQLILLERPTITELPPGQRCPKRIHVVSPVEVALDALLIDGHLRCFAGAGLIFIPLTNTVSRFIDGFREGAYPQLLPPRRTTNAPGPDHPPRQAPP